MHIAVAWVLFWKSLLSFRFLFPAANLGYGWVNRSMVFVFGDQSWWKSKYYLSKMIQIHYENTGLWSLLVCHRSWIWCDLPFISFLYNRKDQKNIQPARFSRLTRRWLRDYYGKPLKVQGAKRSKCKQSICKNWLTQGLMYLSLYHLEPTVISMA